jgi:hypothetical protein
MVGLRELESLTSCVSSRRSNQLSYRPIAAVSLTLEQFTTEPKGAYASAYPRMNFRYML